MTDAFRSGLVIAIALLVTLLLTPSVWGIQSTPTVEVGDGSVDVEETTRVAMTLSRAPNGLAGFEIKVTVADGSVAEVTDASYPSSFGLTSTSINDDNATITLKAADTGKGVQSNATDIRLASIEVTGTQGGSTELTVDVLRLDDDSGNAIRNETDPGTLSVGGGGSGSESTSTESPTEQSTSTETQTTSAETRTTTSTTTQSTTTSTVESRTTQTMRSMTTSTGTTKTTLRSTRTRTSSARTTGGSTTTVGSTLMQTRSPTARSVTTAATRTPGQSGFGVLVALAVLFGVGLLAVRRR